MQWREAVLATGSRDGRVRCELCPHRCELGPGETGVCAVRRNDGGRLVTASFAVSVTHLDAIERKPFYHVRPGGTVLTIAGPGCTFRCNYCVNYRLSQFGRAAGVDWTGRPVDVDALVGQALAQGAAIGMSYSEPGLAPELTLAVAQRARPAGVAVVWKTNGFLTGPAIDLVAPVLTAVNVDVKAADEAAHRRLTGAALAPVLDAIERFRSHGVWVEVSTPLIPGVSAALDEVRRIAGYLVAVDRNIPWHLVRFTPAFRLGRFSPTAPDALAAARACGLESGLRYVYVERALGPRGRNTRCPGCDRTLIEREVWRTISSRLVDGACPACRHPVPGRWS